MEKKGRREGSTLNETETCQRPNQKTGSSGRTEKKKKYTKIRKGRKKTKHRKKKDKEAFTREKGGL